MTTWQKLHKLTEDNLRISLVRSNEEIVALMKQYNTKANLKVSERFGKVFLIN